MSRAMSKVAMAVVIVGWTSIAALAQQSTTSQSKAFEVISVQGHQLVVSLPEGTKEITVPDNFRFTVNGKQLSVSELRPGMKGMATITTTTTSTPVTVTEIKNGTVAYSAGSTIIVRTDDGIKSFTQGEIDKRGVKIMRAGKPAQISDFRQGDKLSATIITSMPPKVVTEQEVNAELSSAGGGSGGGTAARASGTASSSGSAGSASSGNLASSAHPARTLPKTASQLPAFELTTFAALAIGLGLTIGRRSIG
jgi:hypothetical protein